MWLAHLIADQRCSENNREHNRLIRLCGQYRSAERPRSRLLFTPRPPLMKPRRSLVRRCDVDVSLMRRKRDVLTACDNEMSQLARRPSAIAPYGAMGGKSEPEGQCRVTPGQGDLTDSGTENTPLTGASSGATKQGEKVR